VVLVTWFAFGSAWRLLVVGLASAALALQTAGVRRLRVARGVTTTYVTGTLVGFVQDLADGHRGQVGVRVASVLALVVGAVVATAAVRLYEPLAPSVQLLFVASAIVALSAARSR
jgi:uncharacterized membrane protein YoaK (UPF0700 family)